MLPTRHPSQEKRPTQTESEGLEKIFQANGKEKKLQQQYLYPTKQTSKKKKLEKDTEGHFRILKGRIHQEDINIINIYVHDKGSSKYIRKILEDFKKEIDSNKLIVGFFFKNTLPKMDRSFKKYIKKYIVELKDTLDQMDLTDIYIQKLSSQRSKIHILFKCTQNIFKDRPHDRTQNKPQQIQEN